MAELLALGFQRRGHDVVVLCRSGSPVHERLRAHVPCEPILRRGSFNVGTQARCAQALQRHRPDVVIGNTVKEPGWVGLPARALGIPFVYRHEFSRPYESDFRSRLVFGRVPNVHVVNSRSSLETVLAAPWVPAKRVRLIRNGIDSERLAAAPRADLGLPDGSLALGFVGRFEAQKGVRELARAWPVVARALPHAHLILVGWGVLEEALKAALEGAPRVHWLGFRDDVPSLMQAFDVLLAPFHREGFGLVLAEAMSLGVPVVASRGGAIPELLDDGVEGRLVSVGDADALAQATIEVACDDALRRRMGAAGRARAARDFTWERVIREHEDLLEELAAASRKRPARPQRGAGDARRADLHARYSS
jgi:glycosyltransferase involved in cell wall biosynthesis